jgi:hypothetical protein
VGPCVSLRNAIPAAEAERKATPGSAEMEMGRMPAKAQHPRLARAQAEASGCRPAGGRWMITPQMSLNPRAHPSAGVAPLPPCRMPACPRAGLAPPRQQGERASKT